MHEQSERRAHVLLVRFHAPPTWPVARKAESPTRSKYVIASLLPREVDITSPWCLLGGLASPLYIASGILLFPRLGALAAGGLFVAGQMVASVALVLSGALGVPRQPPTRASWREPWPCWPAWLLLGLLAGAVLPVQGAINAQLRAALEEPVAVALVSFLVAALTISVVLVVLLVLRRTPVPRLPSTAMPWWGRPGGVCAAYVTGTFLLIPGIGAAVTVALTVTGQQLASALVDARGWLRLPHRPVTAVRGAGLLLLVAGSCSSSCPDADFVVAAPGRFAKESGMEQAGPSPKTGEDTRSGQKGSRHAQ